MALIDSRIEKLFQIDRLDSLRDELKMIFADEDLDFSSDKSMLAALKNCFHSKDLDTAKKYIDKAIKARNDFTTNGVNDLNLYRWKDHDDIITDSLWNIEKRDNQNQHENWYHGNFVPQIPYQMISRYTKEGDWILDGFMGSGTTLIEAKRLGRNAVGIELSDDVAKRASSQIENQEGKGETKIVVGDSRRVQLDRDDFSLLMLHPPYHNIIEFSDQGDDLSNMDYESFLEGFREVVSNTVKYLKLNGYATLVIGDKYEKGRYLPLGFQLMQIMQNEDLILKATLVKNIQYSRGKERQHSLWRYRALKNGNFVFRHEYIFLFQKK